MIMNLVIELMAIILILLLNHSVNYLIMLMAIINLKTD